MYLGSIIFIFIAVLTGYINLWQSIFVLFFYFAYVFIVVLQNYTPMVINKVKERVEKLKEKKKLLEEESERLGDEDQEIKASWYERKTLIHSVEEKKEINQNSDSYEEENIKVKNTGIVIENHFDLFLENEEVEETLIENQNFIVSKLMKYFYL
jgi:Ca2+/Na+ antiporter